MSEQRNLLVGLDLCNDYTQISCYNSNTYDCFYNGAVFDSEFYDKAFNSYYSLMQNHGADWRVWWGMLRSRTQNFLLVNVDSNTFQTAEHYYTTAMKHAPDDKKKECEATYEKWKGLVFAYNKAIADAYKRYKLGRKRT